MPTDRIQMFLHAEPRRTEGSPTEQARAGVETNLFSFIIGGSKLGHINLLCNSVYEAFEFCNKQQSSHYNIANKRHSYVALFIAVEIRTPNCEKF